jgi:hypothetical protein
MGGLVADTVEVKFWVRMAEVLLLLVNRSGC